MSVGDGGRAEDWVSGFALLVKSCDGVRFCVGSRLLCRPIEAGAARAWTGHGRDHGRGRVHDGECAGARVPDERMRTCVSIRERGLASRASHCRLRKRQSSLVDG